MAQTRDLDPIVCYSSCFPLLLEFLICFSLRRQLSSIPTSTDVYEADRNYMAQHRGSPVTSLLPIDLRLVLLAKMTSESGPLLRFCSVV